MRNSLAVHTFDNINSIPFQPEEYSRMKFGSNIIAKKYGHELADKFFATHTETLLTNRCVVIPSPYNHVRNAASMMTDHFVDRLNALLVNANGEHVETSLIHRKVSYTNDYGFLSKEKRKSLIDNDQFYLNRKFLKGKVLIFVDDVRITGTHEEKLVEVLGNERLFNDAFFLYYGDYINREVGCDIEGAINFAGMTSLADYLELSKEPGHQLIVRPIKFLLSQDEAVLTKLIDVLPNTFVQEMYHACLGEGYYRIPQYQNSFQLFADRQGS